MRSLRYRLRHAVFFEILALSLIVPLGAIAFGVAIYDFGVVGLVSATLATLWNMVYNFAFDLALRHISGTTKKSGLSRILHAVLFEVGLLIVLIPFIAWYLDVSIWQALVMDAALTVFYIFYALGFNWAYDKIFPLPEWSKPITSDELR